MPHHTIQVPRIFEMWNMAKPLDAQRDHALPD
jgi:hypothetical protein